MVASRCPLCGYVGDDFARTKDRRLACPRCGEVAGEAGTKPVDVEGRTLTVGTALAGVGLLSLAAGVVWLGVVLIAPPPLPPDAGQPAEVARAARIGYYAGQWAPGVMSFGIGVIELACGVQLARRRMWPLAVFGAVVAMIPCSCGFVVGLPIGIWALVVLFHPAVRAGFR